MKNNIFAKAIFCLFILGSFSACGTLSRIELDLTDAEKTRYFKTGDLKFEVDSLAKPKIDQKITPGLVVGVLLPNGSTEIFGYGVTSEDNGHRPNGDTLFAVGSVSKGFLAATAAVLVQEGFFSWDDTLESLLPKDTPLSEYSKNITLLQLATHTSGLPRQPFNFQTLAYLTQYLFTGDNFYRHFNSEYIIKYLSDFNAQKQSLPQYSNIGYALLGYVMEFRTGKKVDVLVHEKILLPLSLLSTGYVPSNLPGYQDRAFGYAGDQPKFIRRDQPVPDWKFTDVLTGSAALYSNANDLLSYAAAHIQGSGNSLLDHALEDSLRVRFDRKNEAAALAWIVDDIAGRKIEYQIGLVAGYSSYIGMDVKNKTAVVVLQNSFNWDNSIGHRLLLRMAPPVSSTLVQRTSAPQR